MTYLAWTLFSVGFVYTILTILEWKSYRAKKKNIDRQAEMIMESVDRSHDSLVAAIKSIISKNRKSATTYSSISSACHNLVKSSRLLGLPEDDQYLKLLSKGAKILQDLSIEIQIEESGLEQLTQASAELKKRMKREK